MPDTAQTYDRIRSIRKGWIYMGTNRETTEIEKKLLQAKHRMEEARARNQVQERTDRTRRLIQEGAIQEKAFLEASSMELEALERFLCSHLQRHC